MEIDSNLLAYWQHGLLFNDLMQVQPSQIKQFWRQISRVECESGKIADQAAFESLMLRGSTMVLAPYYAQKNDAYFIPYFLLVELNQTGKFISKTVNALPIIPKSVVEPARLNPIVLGSAEDFDNYLAIHPPIWQDDPDQLNWQAQLAYADQLLIDVNNNQWREDLEQLGYTVHADSSLIFPWSDLTSVPKMDLSLLSRADKVEIIAAPRNSNKTEYAKGLIEDAWIEAAVKKAPPPAIVCMQDKYEPKYANILQNNDTISDVNIEGIHSKLHLKFNTYVKGKQMLRNWQEINQRLHSKYAEHGGIKARQKQLEEKYADSKAQYRLLQVLYSIWLRQTELVSVWSLPFDIIPTMQRSRLQRLYKFFKENLPTENVKGKSQSQMEELISDKIKRSESSERCAADALHQVENDMQQEALVRNKLEDWQQLHHYDIASDKIWVESLKLAKQYWLTYFTLHSEYADYFTKIPANIDLLIIEHAEYISPMHAAALLAISNRAVIIGAEDHLHYARFSTQIDYEIAKNYDLVTCDADFEDLQYAGRLASISSFWDLTLENCEISRSFNSERSAELIYEILDVHGTSQRYLGSRVNVAEIEAIVQWLQANHKITMDIAIYTNFSGQRRCLLDALQAVGFNNIPVYLLQDAHFVQSKLTIFSPVYTDSDPGPYNFDRGTQMLDNLLANTTRKLLVVCDSRIFKPKLHSAAGKFARLFVEEEALCLNN